MTEGVKKAVKVACWIVGVPVALLFLVMALSPVAKVVINHHGPDIIGRETSVSHVFINPFVGSVRLTDFHCKEANGITDFVAFDKLYVRIRWTKLAGKEVDIRHIHLTNWSGEILNGPEVLNFSDIITRFSRNDTVPRDTTPSEWTVSLNDMRLVNGTLLYHDVIRDNRWVIDNINLNIPGLYFGAQQSRAGLQFDLPTGGSVNIKAGYVMASRHYMITLGLENVNSNVALPLVQDYLRVSGLGALINGELFINGSLDNVRDIVASGNLSLSGLQITDEDDDPVAGLDEIHLTIRRGDLANNRWLLDTLTITGLTGHFERNERYNTFSRLKQDVPEVEPDSVTVEEDNDTVQTPPMTWEARYLRITGKDISFEDNSMRKNVEYTINDFTLSGQDITAQGHNSLRLVAHAGKNATLNATFAGGTDIKHGQHTLNIRLTGVDITDFSQYAEYYFGYPLNNGILSLQSAATIRNGYLNSDNKITIDHPEVGKKMKLRKPKIKNVPLKLGVDMLTSAQGIMVLEVPISGNITSPKFRFGKVAGRAVAKVFFGPLMGIRDNRELISQAEAEEITELVGE
ncbi:MAG: DUF748 domain-containing protein [Paludibacteraceae bacterium]|nr:DUF748 domain-containing protein [Paludibacteraceae bacterium]